MLIHRVFDLQIVHEKYYMEKYVQKAEKEVYTSGTRGEIKDCNGKVLAYNKLAYSVVIEDKLENSKTKNQQLNKIIADTIELVEKNKVTVSNDFPIQLDKNGNLTYSFSSDSAKKTFLINIYGKQEYDKKPTEYQNASATEVYNYLIGSKKYEIDQKTYSKEQSIKILRIRYDLSLNNYSKYITTTIASNVNDAVVAAIYENENDLLGVSISEDTVRVYNDAKYFAPIIGYTGRISEDQLAEYVSKKKNYINTDVVGKSGIEASMENRLQGKKGYKKIFVDSTGTVVGEIENKESKPGNDVYLTIDRDLQIATYNLLEQKIAGILISNIVNHDVKKVQNSDEAPIQIGVKDVYYQLINNNVVDITKLNTKNASPNSKRIYSKFNQKLSAVITQLNQQLISSNPETIKGSGDEYQEYQFYIYDLLENNNLLLSSKIDKNNDSVYQKYYKGTISMKEFLTYAIRNEWINIPELHLDAQYTDTNDIYQALLKKTSSLLKKDTGFAKIIYNYMVHDGTVSGSEVCLLLYDQKILKYNNEWYNKLSAGNSNVAYNFIRQQLSDLTITPAQIALDPCSGSVVITDPNTGNVKAMVTYPSYDNNNLSGQVDTEYWQKLTSDKSSPLVSRSTQSNIAPGSTFKPISAIAGLEEGVITTGSYINCTGVFDAIKPSPKCWIYPSAHGSLNVTKAIGVSCNFFFYDVGYRLSAVSSDTISNDKGLSRIEKYAKQFGLTSKSGVEVTESSPHFSTTDAVRSAIGQGSHAYTNVQMARYVNTLANRGKNYKLTLISKVENNNGKVIYKKKPVLQNTVNISDSTWNAVYEGMKSVTKANGTVGDVFEDLGIEVAGKTGTAQENKKRYDHGLFIGFAPADNPKMAISVTIPNADSSSYPAEVARDVLKYQNGKLKLKDIQNGKASIPTSDRVSD